VETDKALAPRLLTFIEDTETALVHVSALLAPLVKTIPVGTTVKRPLMMILLHENLREEVLHIPHGYTPIFMGTVRFTRTS
jgi:hypothetical protein